MGNIAKWKESLVERTSSRQTINLMQLVYGKSTSMPTTSINEHDSSADDESDGDDFFKPKGEVNKVCLDTTCLYLAARGAFFLTSEGFMFLSNLK